ncbi:hypothetical protein ACI780_20045 [Geodermatophilus sp. SYSU D00814]
MTTTTPVRVPAPRTPDHDTLPATRGRAVTSLSDPALVSRALRSGTRLAAEALTGVAFDDPCCAARQRELVRWTAGVVAEVRAHPGLRRDGDVALDAVLARTDLALALFARELSAGAPALALALTDLADLVEARLREAAALPGPARRGARQALFALPRLLDACHPAEQAAVLRTASRAELLTLRLGARRHAATRDAVLGAR